MGGGMLQGERLCPPKFLGCSLTPSVMVFGGGSLGGGRAEDSQVSVPFKQRLQGAPSPFRPVRTEREMPFMKQEAGPQHTEPTTASTLDFQAVEL